MDHGGVGTRGVPVAARQHPRRRRRLGCVALVVAVALVTLKFAPPSARIPTEGGDGAPGHGHSAAHGAVHGAAPKPQHGGHGGHGAGHHEEEPWWHVFTEFPRLVMAQLAVVMALSAMFERSEESVRERLDHAGDEVGGKILDGLFKEFTGMGFLGLLVFMSTASGAVDVVADALGIPHEGHNPVSHTFEMVHMMIFLLLCVLLAQAGMILHISRGVAGHWGIFEDTRCFGPPTNSLESELVKTGHLERVENKNAARGIDLVMKEKFHYGRTQWERFRKRMCEIHSMIMWRAIRHEFLFGDEEEAGKVPAPSMFDFKAYLNSRLGHTVLGLVEVSGRVWIISIVGLCPVVSFCMRMSSPQIVQFLISWGLCAAGTAISLILAEDVHLITPTVPEDPRQILLLFADTNSTSMTTNRSSSKDEAKALAQSASSSGLHGRRLVSMDAISYERDRRKDPRNLVPIPLGAPGLGDCSMDKRRVRLGCHEYLDPKTRKVPKRFLSISNYSDFLQAIGLWQAMCIASLLISGIDIQSKGSLDLVLYALTWLEWPVMMGFVVPSFIHQLTILDSVGCMADKSVIRRVTLDTKEGILG
jgi:hypothetical protein